PGSATVGAMGTQQFQGTGKDQFGNTLSTQPAWTWSLTGIGSINASGMYTAPASAGSATVKAASGAMSNTAAATVVTSPHSLVTPASATPSPVTGTTTNLSVLGTDNSGAASLTY